MTRRVCENCRWWKDGKMGMGNCCRRAPFETTWKTSFCGEWSDKNITPEQEERQKFVRQIFLAMTASEWGANYSENDMWKIAGKLAAAEPQIQKENEQ